MKFPPKPTAPATRTDSSMLRAILSVREKISQGETTSFRRMLEDLDGGKVVSLSKKQRAWVSERYLALDLDKQEGKLLPPKVRVPVRVAPSDGPSIWDQPKAVRPPGRK